MSQSPSQFDVSSVQMVFSNVIVDVTIPRRSFVFGQLHAKVAAGFTNVRSLAVTAFDLLYCSLSVLWFVFVLEIGKQSSYNVYRFVCNTYIVRL